MPMQVHPVKGHWYHDKDAGRDFQVTWVDEDETLVEAKFEDGHIEQYPVAAWQDLRLEPRQGEGQDWQDRSPDDFPEAD